MVFMKPLFSLKEIKEFENILCGASGSEFKLSGFKKIIEPAKVKALNHFDPYFQDGTTWAMFEGSDVEDDVVMTKPSGSQRTIEYKLEVRWFYDPRQRNQRIAPLEDYCVMKYLQFERYKKLPNKIILMERLICNFDKATTIGRANCDAYEFAARRNSSTKRPEPSWDYLVIYTDDLKQWTEGKDYGLAPNKKNGDWLVVFNRNNVRRRINLTKYLRNAQKKGILISVLHEYVSNEYYVEDMAVDNWP
jgi:hypothetical protein